MTGYIAEFKRETFQHRFGGTSWKVSDPNCVEDGPALLMVLDLADPRLSFLELGNKGELPLVSYINNSIWWERQTYLFENGKAWLTERTVVEPELLEPEDRRPNPLPERPLALRPMRREENPDEVGREAGNTVTGPAFIRVGGPPFWLDWPVEVKCTCTRTMIYAAFIGYYLDIFFIGEGALYFFVCPTCRKFTVLSQST